VLKKLLYAIVVIVLVAFAAMPIFAQEAMPVADMVITTPPVDLAQLPPVIASGMAYQTPADNCRDLVVVGESCSSYEGQSVFGQFTLAGQTEDVLDERPEALVATGDVINVRWNPPVGYTGPIFRDEEGNAVVFPPEIRQVTGSNVDVIVVVNNGQGDLPLTYDGQFGSFRGFFSLGIINTSWTPELVANLRDLHLRYMVSQSDPAIAAWLEADQLDQDGPYPQLNPRNCSTVEDIEANDRQVTYCDQVNALTAVWQNGGWTYQVGAYGVTNRNTAPGGVYIPLDQVLQQLAVAPVSGG
jgi:hypothetical protein